MNKEEKEHVLSNLPGLLESIRPNSLLLADLIKNGIIGLPDRDEVNAKHNNYDKCDKLLEILITRKEGFNGLLQALRGTNQCGAIEILEGVTRQSQFTGTGPTFPQPTEYVPLQQKWEAFMLERQHIFTTTRASDAAIAELITKFYFEEMNARLAVSKHVGVNVLTSLHTKLKNAILYGISNKAIHLFKICKVEEVLKRAFRNVQEKYSLSLNGNVNIDDAPAIGIDLGTCNCCVAVCINGIVKIIANDCGEKTTPSYIAFEDDGSETVGIAARDDGYRNPIYTIYDSKRLIGRDFSDQSIQNDRKKWQFKVVETNGKPMVVTPNTTLSPVVISSKLLQECVKYAEVDLQKKVTKAVITVPAYFNDSQIKATVEAGETVGITVLQILKEPTAAAIMYRQERNYHVAKRVLIFDMGGGTFDVAIADISDDEIDIIGIDGDTHLGGEDFDAKIMEFCINEFKMTTGHDLRTWKSEANNKRNLAALKLQCEQAKKHLSSKQTVKIILAQDADNVVSLTRAKFEILVLDLFDRMINILKRLLQTTRVPKENIEDIILVGGSTRIPKLKDMLSNFFDGRVLNHNANQDYAVAYGAAVMAAVINGEEAKRALNLRNIKDVIPMSIGVQCIKDGVAGRFTRIIMKNSKYPFTHQEIFSTHKDNQETARIRVFQGEHDNVDYNFFIGEFRFEGIPKALKGEQSIEVIMEIDKMGILKVKASCGGVFGTKNFDFLPDTDKGDCTVATRETFKGAYGYRR